MKIKNAHLTHSSGPLGQDLHLKAGEITLLGGDSGSGKTSLMLCISGFKDLKAGEMEPAPQAVAMLLQNPFHQIIMQKAYDELLFPMKNAGMADGEAQAELSKIANMLKIEHLLDRDMNTLSFGETQLLMIAATCLSPANIYCFDEATSHLDPPYIKLFYAVLRYLADKNKIILASTQSLDEYAFADNVIILNKGSIQDVYSKAEWKNQLKKASIKTDRQLIINKLEGLAK
ncbi:MAG: ABC transporter ATP-binding protein [Candidatus Neomarinimicrobiota bacterium]|jgi:energy-coupling factor transport system ATP-binding protein